MHAKSRRLWPAQPHVISATCRRAHFIIFVFEPKFGLGERRVSAVLILTNPGYGYKTQCHALKLLKRDLKCTIFQHLRTSSSMISVNRQSVTQPYSTSLHGATRTDCIKRVFKIEKITICSCHYLEAYEMPFSVAQRIIRENTTAVGTFGCPVSGLTMLSDTGSIKKDY